MIEAFDVVGLEEQKRILAYLVKKYEFSLFEYMAKRFGIDFIKFLLDDDEFGDLESRAVVAWYHVMTHRGLGSSTAYIRSIFVKLGARYNLKAWNFKVTRHLELRADGLYYPQEGIKKWTESWLLKKFLGS